MNAAFAHLAQIGSDMIVVDHSTDALVYAQAFTIDAGGDKAGFDPFTIGLVRFHGHFPFNAGEYGLGSQIRPLRSMAISNPLGFLTLMDRAKSNRTSSPSSTAANIRSSSSDDGQWYLDRAVYQVT